MNKIFKVVWSKTKRCYVVMSELAKNHTKSNQVKSEAASKRGWFSVFGGIDWSSATARAVMAALVVTGALGLSTGVSAADGTPNQNPTGEHFVSVNYGTYKPGAPTLPGYDRVIYNDYVDTFTEYQKKLISNAYAGTTIDSTQNTAYVKKLNAYAQELVAKGVPLNTINSSGVNNNPLFTTEYNTDGTIKNVTTDLKTLVAKYRGSSIPSDALRAVSTAQKSASSLANYSVVKDYVDTYAAYQNQWIRAAYMGDTVGSQATTDQITRLNELRTALLNSGLTQQDIDGLQINKIAGITQSVKNNQIDSINVDLTQLVQVYEGMNQSYANNDVTGKGSVDKDNATNLLGQIFPDTSNYNNDLAKGKNSIAIGLGASTSDKAANSVAIGVDAYAGASDVVAIGNTAISESANSIAIGKNISIDSNVPSNVKKPTNAIAIGMGIKLTGNVFGSVVIGGPAEKSDKVFTSVENNGKNHAGYSVAIGAGARVANYLLGSNAKYANGYIIGGDGGGVAVGPRVWATGQATAMGNDTYALGGSSIAIGSDDNPSVYSSRISAYDGIHYYYQLYRNLIDQEVENGEDMTNKYNNKNGFYLDKAGNMVRFSGSSGDDRAKYSPTMARGVGSIAIGSRSIAYADGSNAFGTVAQALADGATAFGTKTRAEGKSSMSMGNNSQVFANNAIVAGSDSQVFSQGGNAYGYRVYASGQNSLAIGSDAYANASMVFLSDSTGTPVFSKDGAYNEDPAKAATSILSNNTDVTSKFDSLLANNSKKSLISTATAKDSVSNTDAGLQYAHVNVATRYHGLENVVARQAGSENVSINDIMYDKDGKVTTDVGVAVKVEDAKYNASLYKNNAIAIGSSAIAQGDNGVSLGHGAIGLGDNSMAIGTYSMTTGNNSVAFGLASRAAGDNTLAMGTAAASMGKNALAVGIGAINYGDNSTVMGYTTGIGEGSKNSITIGAATMIGSGITDSLVIGTGSSIGKYAVLSGDSAGNTSGVNGIYAVDRKTGKVMTDGNALSSLKGLEAEKISGAMAIGVDSRVYSRYGGKKTIKGEDGTPVEVEINPGETGNNAMAIGNNAQAWLDNSLALGNQSKTDYTLEWLNAPAYVTPNAVAVSTDGRTGVISVGSIGNERRIVNVAAGSRDTDAVNVSQLKQMWGTVQRELDPTDRNRSVHFLATNYHPTSKGNNSPDYSSLYSKQVAYQRYVKYATEYKSYLVQEAYGGPGLTDGARASYKKELSDLKQELSDLGYVEETDVDKFDVSGITDLNTKSDEEKQAAKQKFKTEHGDDPNKVLQDLFDRSAKDTEKLNNGDILKTGSMQTGLTPETLAEKLTLINHDNTQGLTKGSIAVGYNARVGMKDNTGVVSGQEGGIAIGHMARNYATKNVEVDGYSAGSIALGDKSLVLESDLGTKDTDTDTIKVQPGVYYNKTIDGKTIDLNSITGTPNAGVVSVGASADKSEEWGGEWKQSTRRIINVAAGANDTDAVNVSQLKSLAAQTIKFTANGITTTSGEGETATTSKTTTDAVEVGTTDGMSFSLKGADNGKDITTTASGTDVTFTLNKATEVTAGDNHVVTSDAVYKAIENVNTDVTNLTNGLAGNMVYTDKDGNRVVKDGDNFYTKGSLAGAEKVADGTYYNIDKLAEAGAKIENGKVVGTDGNEITDPAILDKVNAAKVEQVKDVQISAVDPKTGEPKAPTTIGNVQSTLVATNPEAIKDPQKTAGDIASTAMTGDKTAKEGTIANTGLLNAEGSVLNNAATIRDLQTVANAGLTFQTNNLAEEGNNAGKVQTIHKALGETLNIEGKKDATFDGTKYSADNLVTTNDNGTIRIAMLKQPTLEGLTLIKETKITEGGTETTVTNTVNLVPKKAKDGTTTLTLDNGTKGEDGKNGNVRISGVADGKEDNDAVNVSQLNDLKTIINGNPGTEAPKGEAGPSGKDGLNGQNMGAQITAIREGTAGTMVYTVTNSDGKQERVTAEGNQYYKNSDLNLTDYTKAVDGKWYKASEVDPKTGLPKDEAKTVDFAKDVVKSDDKGNKLPPVNAKDIHISAVNAVGDVTGPTIISNVQSNLASSTKKLKADATDDEKKAEADRVATIATKAMTGNPEAEDALGKSGLINATGDVLNNAATLGDLQTVAQAGLTFQTNNDKDGELQTIHKTLGETLNIEGQKGAKFDGEKYSADNLVTTNDEGTIRIAMLKKPTLEGLKLETKETKTNEDGTSTDVTHTVIMTPTTDGGTTALTLNNGKTSTDGSPVDTRVKISNVANGTAPNDAVNYSQLQNLDNQVKELQNGENGPMVYTDGEGNRLVKSGDTLYKASDVKASDLVTNDGTHYDATNLPEGAKLSDDGTTVVAKDGSAISEDELSKAKLNPVTSNVQISAVDPKTGEPKAPTTIGNVKSNYGYNGIGTEADDKGEKVPAKGANAFITKDDAQKAMGSVDKDGKVISEGLLTAKGADLNKVVTVGDLQAAAQAGLDFTGNSKTEGKVDTAHTTLGGTIAIQGGTEYNANDFSDKNISTKVDPKTKTISINIKTKPEFDSVILGEPDKQVTIRTDSTANGNEVNFASTHPQGGDTNVVLSGIKDDPTRRDTAITRGALEDLGILESEVGPSHIAGSDVGGNLSNEDNLNEYSLNKQVQAQREGLSGNVVYTDTKGNRLVKAGNRFYSAAPLNKYILENKLRQDPSTGMWFNISDFDEDNNVKEEAKGKGLTAEQLAEKAEVSETQVSDIKLSAVNMSGDTNTPTEIGNIKSTIGLNGTSPKLDDKGQIVRDDTGMPVMVPSVVISAKDAKTAMNGGTDGFGVEKEGLLNVKGSQLNTVATVGDLQAVAQAGLDFKANNNSDGTKNPLHRTLGSEISIKGADANDGKTFAPDTSDTLPKDKTINDYAFNANNIMTQVQGNVIRIGMKSAPEFTGVNLISANQPTLRLENKDGHLMLTEVKGDVVQSSVRLATQNDGFYIKDANGNKTLVRINNTDAIEFNKYLTVTTSDSKSDDTSATGNTGTTGNTGSGTSTGENVNAGTTTGGNTTGGNTMGASTSDTTPKAVGTVDVVVKDTPTDPGDIANKKYVDKQ
ncbi:ESPR-type extended signal peptide-containing protein, partial [Veillonella magna]|uniref:ESPR-type extended signal peptide-containing protein n=1 Tax=Veillonella magna TaxID=464322 RepID=UPI0023F45BC4